MIDATLKAELAGVVSAERSRFFDPNYTWTYAPSVKNENPNVTFPVPSDSGNEYNPNGSVTITQDESRGEITGPSIDCSDFVMQAMLAGGFYVGTTNINSAELTNIANGTASQYYQGISKANYGDVVPGDVVVFSGHVGIVTSFSFDPATGIGHGTFDGAEGQTSGLEEDVAFTTNGGFFGVQFKGFVQPTTYNPSLATGVLYNLNYQINAGLAASGDDPYFPLNQTSTTTHPGYDGYDPGLDTAPWSYKLVSPTASIQQITYQLDENSNYISSVQDNTDGTSELETYGADGSSVTTTYSGLDGTGDITGVDAENSDSTSTLTSYASDGSSTATSYTGPHGTGEITQVDQENADGTSQITTYNEGVPVETQSYSGPNGTGSPIPRVINVASDESVVIAVNQPGDVANFFGNGGSLTLQSIANLDLTTHTEVGLYNNINYADSDQFGDQVVVGGPYDGTDGDVTETFTSQQVACYTRDTRIATPGGECAVEDLKVGDMVLTDDGRAEPVRWIGRRSYGGRFLVANPGVQPICFRAGSLGNGLPRRDLLVSPEHAMFLDGLLIPARCLVNWTTIIQERSLERVEYFHVELDTHDVLLAEGAPSESFMDDDSRGMFHNAHEFAALYPDAPRADGFCAPRVTDGYELEAIRQRLAVVAGQLAQAA